MIISRVSLQQNAVPGCIMASRGPMLLKEDQISENRQNLGYFPSVCVNERPSKAMGQEVRERGE